MPSENSEIRRELCGRFHHAVVEAEAAFWTKLKEMFPEVTTPSQLDAAVAAALWEALDGVARAWALENVPGMVEAMALERTDAQEAAYPRDERDQT